ncbi:MAG: alpha-L-arabinofuranosidase [Chthoniobacteraceae bacterium]
MQFVPFSLALALSVSLCTGEPEPVRIQIDARKPVQPVNARVFGQFIKGADNYGIFSAPRPDLAVLHEGDGLWDPSTQAPYPQPYEILQAYKPGLLRYPDGLGVHNHDWKKTIGPVEMRGDWKFGLPEFMRVCEGVCAEPIFVVSEYIGTPRDAADLVEYLNLPADDAHPWAQKRAQDGHPEPYKVKYFEMGNESWVDWRKFGKTAVRPPAEVARYASEMAAAMKAVDPGIQCGIPYGEEAWSKGVLPFISKEIDFVVVHAYPVKYGGADLSGEKERRMLEAMMASGYEMAGELKNIRGVVRECTGRDLPFFITEYNMGPTQMQPGLERPYRYSLAAALGTGDFLGRILQPGSKVEGAIYWSWLNGFFESVHTYAGEPMKTLQKLDEPSFRPVHSIFQLWAKYRGSQLLAVQTKSPGLAFPGFTSMKPCIGSQIRKATQLDAQNLIDGAREVPFTQPHINATREDNGTWSLRLDQLSGKAFPNLLIRSFENLPTSLRPPTAGLVYHVSFDARWQPAEPSMMPNLGLGVGDSRGWNASGSAIGIQGLQAAREWEHFSDIYQPMPDTQGLTVLARVEGGSTPITGTLDIKNLRIEAWSNAAYPERPALTSYATRSADGKKLYLVVFNLTLDQDYPAQLSWKGFAARHATYSELNASGAASVNRPPTLTQWTATDTPLKLKSPDQLSHSFPAHSATGIELDAEP